MNLVIDNHTYRYETEKLISVFFPSRQLVCCEREQDSFVYTGIKIQNGVLHTAARVSDAGRSLELEQQFSMAQKGENDDEDSFCERKLMQTLYRLLCDFTGYTPPWGLLTGVRPAKLMSRLVDLYEKGGAKRYFENELFVSGKKTELALTVSENQRPLTALSAPNSFSLYISIPFCPTRCKYCSFVSHSNENAKKLIGKYLIKLCEELEYIAETAKRLGLSLSSVYIGGGTPTTLSAEQLEVLLCAVEKNFQIGSGVEFTVEAGRPDSIDEQKLLKIKKSAAGRISINPQTFDNNVLKSIDRRHSAEMTVESYKLARRLGFNNINMDVIAGLTADSVQGFEKTMEKAIMLAPENITVHTLAVKRSSALAAEKQQLADAKTAEEMLSTAYRLLSHAGYRPYYMYRQSNCVGNLENVGFSKPGFECRYNVYMMEECHTVLAAGAGAVTKLKNPYSGQIERIFNYKYPYEYINDFPQIISRKQRVEEFYNSILN